MGLKMRVYGFDLEHLKPTYQLLIGIPGRSNAFAISKKLGLDDAIIKRAETFLNDDQIHIEELLKNIYDDKLWIENEKQEIEKNSNQITLLRKSLEEKQRSFNEKGLSIVEKAKQEARKILLEAKEEASFCISQMNEISKKADQRSLKELNQLRNQLNDSLKETSSVMIEKAHTNTILEEDLTLGCHVYVSSFEQEGIVLSLPNKSHQVQIQIGSMKMLIPVAHISKILSTSSTPSSNGVTNYKTNKSKTATTEINVIGYHVEEAIFMIDKYLDDCALAKLNQIRIVHGKGTGSLRKGIHAFLKTNSHVKNFRFGTFGEGEMGVTIVELK